MVPFKETILTKEELINAVKRGYEDFSARLISKNDFFMFFGFTHGEAITKFYPNNSGQLLIDGGFNSGSEAYFNGGIRAWENLKDGKYSFPPFLINDSTNASPTKESLRQEFKYYLEHVARSSRRTEAGFNLGNTAVGSYLSFIDNAERLFDYNPQKWAHIESMYDITDPEKAKEIVDEVLNDPEFVQRDKDNNQMFRSGALMHYVCFLYARNFFGNHLPADNPDENPSSSNSGNTSKAVEPFDIRKIISAIKRTGLLYEDKLIQRYACSLMTKPFVILSGLAGSGKTQLALAFARAMSENVEQQLCVVPVGADWTNREPLLGYPNALKQGEYMQPESGALQIMMRALRNPQKPYFLVLDEMNLSYVERYFADFLSALESNQKIPLWEKPDECDSEVDASIALPKNLFIVGTINVDETTYMFSPKVLDRANVIEFKISDTEMEQFLGQNMNIDVKAADGVCAKMGQDFVEKAKNKETDKSELAQRTLLDFFKVLKKVNAEFGYRSATEIYRFIANAKACADGMTEDEILDAAIVQKLLPKLHGSRKKLKSALQALWGLCMTDNHKTEAITRENAEQYAKFKEAADKIQRMMQTALDNGFTSFAEA